MTVQAEHTSAWTCSGRQYLQEEEAEDDESCRGGAMWAPGRVGCAEIGNAPLLVVNVCSSPGDRWLGRHIKKKKKV